MYQICVFSLALDSAQLVAQGRAPAQHQRGLAGPGQGSLPAGASSSGASLAQLPLYV